MRSSPGGGVARRSRRPGFQPRGQGRFTPAPPPVALPPRTAPDAEAAQTKRARLMLAILFAFPALIPEVEEAFSHVRLPEADEALRHALHGFVSRAKTLDTSSLFTHLDSLGLGGRRAHCRSRRALSSASIRKRARRRPRGIGGACMN